MFQRDVTERSKRMKLRNIMLAKMQQANDSDNEPNEDELFEEIMNEYNH